MKKILIKLRSFFGIEETPKIVIRNVTQPRQFVQTIRTSYSTPGSSRHTQGQAFSLVSRTPPQCCPMCRRTDTLESSGTGWSCSFCGCKF